MQKYLPSVRSRSSQEQSDASQGMAGVFSNGWLIAGVFLLISALGIIHALTTMPLYEASTVLQLNRNSLMPGSARGEVLATTEIEILRSRSVLSAVAERLALDISVEPIRHPFIDRIRAALLADAEASDRIPREEPLHLSVMKVPAALLKHDFVLTARGDSRFTITGSELLGPIDGTVGKPAKGRTRYGDVEVLVADLSARPGLQFTLRRIPLLQATEQLQRSLVVVESGKQSNVVRATLQGAKPDLISRILNEIGNEYMRQRAADESEESAKFVGLFDRQLDQSSQALRDADHRYAALLQQYGISDPAEEAKTASEQSVALTSKLDETQQKKLELSARFGEQHPAMEAVNKQIAELTRDLQRNEIKRKSLALAERELSKASQDRAVFREINTGLLSQRNKLDTIVQSTHMDVRLVDRSEAPVQTLTLGFPAMAALSCFAGLFAGLGASILKNVFFRRSRARFMPQRETRFRLISMVRSDASRGA